MKLSSPAVRKSSSTGSVKGKVKYHVSEVVPGYRPTAGSKTVYLEQVSPYRLAQLISRRMLQTCKDLIPPPMTTDHVYSLTETYFDSVCHVSIVGSCPRLIFMACISVYA